MPSSLSFFACYPAAAPRFSRSVCGEPDATVPNSSTKTVNPGCTCDQVKLCLASIRTSVLIDHANAESGIGTVVLSSRVAQAKAGNGDRAVAMCRRMVSHSRGGTRPLPTRTKNRSRCVERAADGGLRPVLLRMPVRWRR